MEPYKITAEKVYLNGHTIGFCRQHYTTYLHDKYFIDSGTRLKGVRLVLMYEREKNLNRALQAQN